jgi:hypothetical protein
MKEKSLIIAILQGGFIAGTADITLACISAYFRAHLSPENLLRFVASGAFGKAANTGGMAMPLLGLLFHYCIAFSFTILFFLLYPKIKFMSVNRVFTGIIYGAFVWCVMTLVVLPFTLVPPSELTFTKVAIGMGILIIAIGMPLSFLAHRFYNKTQ